MAADQIQLQRRQQGRQHVQRRQQGEQRREKQLALQHALIILAILGNAQAGKQLDIAGHTAERRWNIIVAELVAFARPVAVDR